MRVALADDSALFRDGLAMLLGSADIDVVVQARDGDGLMSELAVLPPDSVPDVAILDIRMPPTFTDEGLRTAHALRREHPGVAILVLSTYAETAYAVQVLDIGERATGYLLKDRVGDTGVLLDALDRIRRGETVIDPDIVTRLLGRQRTTTFLERLTDRESEVLKLMAEGRSNAGIAEELFLHTKTIEHYVASVFTRLGLENTSADNRRVLAVLTWLRSDS